MLIDIHNLTKSHHDGDIDVTVLKNISFQIEEGEFVAITGASGSGKSTLLHLIGCLDRPSSGSYKLNGTEVQSLHKDALAALRCHTFGFIFQRYNLLNNESALDNVEVPAIYAGIPHSERTAKAKELLEKLDLGDRLEQYPNQMSGGQQQRVAIARALMNGGYIILADEPTGALDSENGANVIALLRKLNQEGHTVIIVTHDLDIAAQTDRIISLKDGTIVSDSGSKNRSQAISSQAASQDRSNDSSRLDVDVVAEAIKIAWRSLKTHGFRTLLAMLGIIIGVASVVSMMALGNGTKEEILSNIKKMGANLILVRPGAPGIRGNTTLNLTVADATAIGKLPGVLYSVPEIHRGNTIRFQEQAHQATVIATTHDFPNARDWPEEAGTFFTETDYNSYAPVVVLGQTVLKNIFPEYIYPVGQYILIGNTPFQVVGIMTGKGASPGGIDLDDAVWIPLTTGKARLLGGQSNVTGIYVEAESGDAVAEAKDEIEKLMLERHGTVDFTVRSLQAILESAAKTQTNLTWLLGSIALISLIVGGIGVMNIMLVSVSERTREIGIRLANGARTFDIKLQFLTEAIVICLVGGILGVLLGVAMVFVVQKFGLNAILSPLPIILSFSSAFIIGIFFGYIPARNASKQDPIVALSME